MVDNVQKTDDGSQEQNITPEESFETPAKDYFEIRIPTISYIFNIFNKYYYYLVGLIAATIFLQLFKVDISFKSDDLSQQPSPVVESTVEPIFPLMSDRSSKFLERSSPDSLLSLFDDKATSKNTESGSALYKLAASSKSGALLVSVNKSPTSLSKVGISNALKDTMRANQDTWAIDITQPAESARQEVYSRLPKMNGIPIGELNLPPVYVLFDPSCPHCKTMFADAEDLARAAGVHFVFIPISVFLDHDTTVDLSLKLATALRGGFSELAKIAFMNMVKGNMALLNDSTWAYSDDDLIQLAEQTLLFIQIGGGTPAVVWQKNDGAIGIINGPPEANELVF